MKKDKKAFMVGVLCGSLVFGSLTAFAISYTAEPVNFKVLVNGTEFNSDPPAMTINGNTYLPLRAVGDALGVAVNWNSELNQAEVGGGNVATTPQLPANPSTDYSRSNPAPLNTVQTINIDNWSEKYSVAVRIVEATRGETALKLLKENNKYNSDPDEGYEYILAKIALSVLSVEEDKAIDVYPGNFTVFTQNNEEVKNKSMLSIPEPEFRSKLFAGGNLEGYCVFQVKKDDPAPKVVYELNYDGTGGAWFALQ